MIQRMSTVAPPQMMPQTVDGNHQMDVSHATVDQQQPQGHFSSDHKEQQQVGEMMLGYHPDPYINMHTYYQDLPRPTTHPDQMSRQHNIQTTLDNTNQQQPVRLSFSFDYFA